MKCRATKERLANSCKSESAQHSLFPCTTPTPMLLPELCNSNLLSQSFFPTTSTFCIVMRANSFTRSQINASITSSSAQLAARLFISGQALQDDTQSCLNSLTNCAMFEKKNNIIAITSSSTKGNSCAIPLSMLFGWLRGARRRFAVLHNETQTATSVSNNSTHVRSSYTLFAGLDLASLFSHCSFPTAAWEFNRAFFTESGGRVSRNNSDCLRAFLIFKFDAAALFFDELSVVEGKTIEFKVH